MFYEEKVIDGKLYGRSTPGGEWVLSTGAHAEAANALLALTNEQRLDAMAQFCKQCGAQDSGCQCWNDD